MSKKINKELRTIVFLLLPGVHLMDLAGPAQVFYEAGQLGDLDLSIRYVAAKSEVQSEQGLYFSRVDSLEDTFLSERDFLIIPGIHFNSFKEGELKSSIEEVDSWLKSQFEKKVQIATICSGTLIPAELGLLKSHSCTTHWKCIDYMKDHYPESKVMTDQLFVKDGGFYSSAGMTSGIDMCIAIIEELYGPILASQVAREMVIYMRRDKKSSQESIYLDYQTHFNPAVHRVQNFIISNPEENSTLDELSDVANMSTRNLTRTFKQVTGHTITEFKQEVKTELARTLLNNPDYTLEAIAYKCGYENVRQLQRVWKQKFGKPMSDYR